MIRNIVRSTFKVVFAERTALKVGPLCSYRSFFCFSKETFASVMETLQSGKQSKDFPSLIAQIQSMEEENLKMTLFKSVLERINMAVEPLHLLKNEQLNKALKKYPTLYAESVQLQLLNLQRQTQQKQAHSELSLKEKQHFLQEFDKIFGQWSSVIQQIRNQSQIFHFGVIMNKTNNYYFRKYISRYVAESKRGQAFGMNWQWNRHISVMYKKYLELMKNQYLQLISKGKLSKQEEVLSHHQKIYFFQNIQAFAFILTCSNSDLYMINKNKENLKNCQRSLQEDIQLVLELYKTIGFQDIDFVSGRYIELINTSNLISLTHSPSYDQQFKAKDLTDAQIEELEISILKEREKAIETIFDFIGSIKNKQKNLNKWSQLIEAVIVMQITEMSRMQLKMDDIEGVVNTLVQENLKGEELSQTVRPALEEIIRKRLEVNALIASLREESAK